MKRITATLIGLTVLAGCAAAHPAFSFDSPRKLFARTDEQNTAAPQMFFIASGKLYMLLGVVKGDSTGLRLRISDDDGDDFSQAIEVSPKSVSPMLHGEMSPQLSYDPHKQRMYVLYETEREGVDQLEVVASSVWSKHFNSPVFVVRKTTPSPNTFAALGVAPNGNVYVAWLDGRRGSGTSKNTYALYIARSRDGARSFEDPIRVAADVCPCCRPTLAFDAAGNVYVAWRRVYPGNFRDIVVARATQTLRFNAPTRVSVDGWSIIGCPDSGPRLLIDGTRLYVAWYTAGSEGIPQVRVAWSDDNARSFTPFLIASTGVDEANHPAWIQGAHVPTLLWEGRSRTARGWGPQQPFVARILNGHAEKPTPLPVTASVTGVVGNAKDARSIYVAASQLHEAASHVVLIRGHIDTGIKN